MNEESEGERAIEFLRLHGYRKCDIAACNCGSWHGGHEHQRLIEIREAFEQDEHTHTNGKTLLNLVCEVLTDRADYKLRAERAEYQVMNRALTAEAAQLSVRRKALLDAIATIRPQPGPEPRDYSAWHEARRIQEWCVKQIEALLK